MFLEKEKKKERIYFSFFDHLLYIFRENKFELFFLFVKLILMYNITRNSFSIEKKLKVR